MDQNNNEPTVINTNGDVKRVVKVVTTNQVNIKKKNKLPIIIGIVLVILIAIVLVILLTNKKDKKNSNTITTTNEESMYKQDYYIEPIGINYGVNINTPTTIDINNFNINYTENKELIINNNFIMNVNEINSNIGIVDDVLLLKIKDLDNNNYILGIKDKLLLDINIIDNEYKLTDNIVINTTNIIFNTITNKDICSLENDYIVNRVYSIYYNNKKEFTEPELLSETKKIDYITSNNICD